MDGRIHVWDYVAKTRLVVFNGHKTAVSALVFNADGTQLASGARDTDIVVWDVISESGLYR
jgi:U3 small nucleolar RNA-associated protein 12